MYMICPFYSNLLKIAVKWANHIPMELGSLKSRHKIDGKVQSVQTKDHYKSEQTIQQV